MDPQLLKYYERELRYIRDMGAEFAQEYPKIAGRLGIDGTETTDPYVERLYESFAFLAARVHLRIDAEFPKFAENLLNIIYPQYLAPLPSMAIAQFHPNTSDGLEDGVVIPRGTQLRGNLAPSEQTACEYRSAHEVTLWPLEISEAEYLNNVAPYVEADSDVRRKARAGLRIKLNCKSGQNLNELLIDRLPVFLCGSDGQAEALYEQLIGNHCAVFYAATDGPATWRRLTARDAVAQLGFGDDQALLPVDPRTFSGYRLLSEFFALPARFLFLELRHLQQVFSQSQTQSIELVVLFDRLNPELENRVAEGDFSLYCTPVINLFQRRCDRIHLQERFEEHHVLADRTRPLDFEVYQINGVKGFGSSTSESRTFVPFYACTDRTRFPDQEAFYSERRERRVASTRQRRQGPRSSYLGSETFVSLIDASEAPYASDLKQLEIKALCTNRDLPLHLPVGKGATDFEPDTNAPVDVVRCIKGPTRPRASHAHEMGETAWRLINHLSTNYLSLIDANDVEGADVLRNLLSLYGDTKDPVFRRQVEGLRSIHAEPVTRRMPIPGPIAFGRGLRITVTLQESSFVGSGVFLMGAVLEQFFARYVSINSFTETVIRSDERGEVMQWPVRIGQKKIA
ncbi:MAG: type VI secretion system baseplate subunit TssF [Pseudomonadota bacterium]